MKADEILDQLDFEYTPGCTSTRVDCPASATHVWRMKCCGFVSGMLCEGHTAETQLFIATLFDLNEQVMHDKCGTLVSPEDFEIRPI